MSYMRIHDWSAWKDAKVKWYSPAKGWVFGSILMRICWDCGQVQKKRFQKS